MAARAVTVEKVLKVHVAGDGGVWYADGDGVPVEARSSAEEFLSAEICLKARRIRMVGSRENAPLLVHLAQRKDAGDLHRLEVASPGVLGRTRAERRDPRLMLTRISDAVADGLTPSRGGWHEFDHRDYPAYVLAATEDRAPELDQARLRVLSAHPAYAAFSFVAGLDLGRMATLLGIILDPRWYASLRVPSRGGDIVSFSDDSAKLQAYLGLTPRTMAAVLGKHAPTCEDARCRLVVETWAGGQDWSPLQVDLAGPGYFLWRRHAREAGPIKAMLRASQMFIDFVRLVWLDSLYTDRRAGAGPAAPGMRPRTEGLFAPNHFFATRDEAGAFELYMKLAHET
jgi:hypothetical protein